MSEVQPVLDPVLPSESTDQGLGLRQRKTEGDGEDKEEAPKAELDASHKVGLLARGYWVDEVA